MYRVYWNVGAGPAKWSRENTELEEKTFFSTGLERLESPLRPTLIRILLNCDFVRGEYDRGWDVVVRVFSLGHNPKFPESLDIIGPKICCLVWGSVGLVFV